MKRPNVMPFSIRKRQSTARQVQRPWLFLFKADFRAWRHYFFEIRFVAQAIHLEVNVDAFSSIQLLPTRSTAGVGYELLVSYRHHYFGLQDLPPLPDNRQLSLALYHASFSFPCLQVCPCSCAPWARRLFGMESNGEGPETKWEEHQGQGVICVFRKYAVVFFVVPTFVNIFINKSCFL